MLDIQAYLRSGYDAWPAVLQTAREAAGGLSDDVHPTNEDFDGVANRLVFPMPEQLDGGQSAHILFHGGQQETLGSGVWMMPVHTFGDYIRDARLRMKLGLRRAADLLGMSPSYLSKVETNDAREPSGELLHRMARLYELSIPDVMEQVRLRADDMIAADDELGPTIHAFYRLAQGQPLQVREKMLRAAVDVLDLPEGQKERLRIMLARLLSRMHRRDLPRLGSGSAGLFALEVRPRFLSADRIERRAEQILESYFQRPIASIELPIPIEDIAEQIDPDVRVIVDSDLPGGRLRDGSPAVLGMSRWSHDAETRELVLNAELFEAAQPTARRRCSFTTAHELFHCLEHLPLMSLRNPRNALKRQIVSIEFGDPMGRPFTGSTGGQHRAACRRTRSGGNGRPTASPRLS